MSDIDKRVVQFEFDNSKFERNVKQSMSTLDKLKESLNFDKISDNLDKVSLKISALEVAAVAAIANISNRIVNLGVTLVKSLSVDNVAAGWSKFNDKTLAVGTIMSQNIKVAGKTIDDYAAKLEAVSQQLDKLNWFTDETSYNFTTMTETIGKFTASGKGLDESVYAIMGIANWAALSGANAQKASNAMYQLAQAVSKGYVMLNDYVSVQNVGMDTDDFRQVVLDTAVAMKELTQQGDKYITKTGKKFTKSQFTMELSTKWFTSDILLTAMKKYSAAIDDIYKISTETGLTASQVLARYGDQFDAFGVSAFRAAQEARTLSDALNAIKDAVSTGWMNTAEKIFGSYNESKILWTELAEELYDVFAEGGNFRNDILAAWGKLEGKADLFKHGTDKQGAFWNIYDAIVAVINLVKESFNNIFPKTLFSGYDDQVKDLANRFKAFTERLRESTYRIKENLENSERLKNILSGLFSLVRLGLNTLRAVRYALDPIIQFVKGLADDLLTLASNLGISLTRTEKITEFIFNISRKINAVLTKTIEIINPRGIIRAVLNVLSKLVEFTRKLFTETLDLSGALEKVSSIFKSFINNIKQLFGIIDKEEKKASSGGKKGEGPVRKMARRVGVSEETVEEVKEKNKLLSLLKSTYETFEPLLDSLVLLGSSLLMLSKKVIDITAIVITNIALAIQSFSLLDTARILRAVNTFVIIGGIIAALVFLFSKIYNLVYVLALKTKSILLVLDSLSGYLDNSGYAKIVKSIGDAILKLGIAMLMIGVSFQIFGSIDTNAMWRGVGVLTVLGAIILALTLVSKTLTSNIFVAKRQVKNLSDSLKDLAINGGFERSTMQEVSRFLTSFATTVLLLAISFSILGKVDSRGMIAGGIIIGSLVIVVGILTLFSRKLSAGEPVMKKAYPGLLTMLGIAVVIRSFAKALIKLSAVEPKKLIMPLVSMVTVLATLLGVMYYVNIVSRENVEFSKSIKAVASMVTSLLIVSVAFSILSRLSWGDYGLSIAVIASTLLLLASFTLALTKIMKDVTGVDKTILMLSVLSASLISVAGTLAILSKLDTGKMFIGIGAMATIFVLLIGLVLSITRLGKLNNNTDKVILSLAAMTTSLIGLALSLKILSTIDYDSNITKSIIAMHTLILAFAGLTYLVSKSKPGRNVDKAIKALTAISVSLIAFSAAVWVLTKTDPKTMTIALFGMIGFILAVSTLCSVIASLKNFKKIQKTVITYMIPIILSLVAFVASAKLLEGTPWETLIAVFGGISAAMLALALSIKMLSKISVNPATIVLFATSVAILAASLGVFGLSLMVFNDMSWMTIVKGFIALAGAITILTLAGLVLSKTGVAIILLELSAAIFITSAGLFLFGEALTKIAGAIGPFVQAVSESFSSIMDVVAQFTEAMLGIIINTAPMIAEAVFSIITNIVTGIAENSAAIFDSIKTILGAILDLVIELLPKVIKVIGDFIVGMMKLFNEQKETIKEFLINLIDILLDTIIASIPKFVKMVEVLITNVLKSIKNNIKEWANLLIDILINLIDVLAMRIGDITESVATLILNSIIAAFNAISKRLGPLINALLDFIISVLDTLGETIKNRSGDMMETFVRFGMNIMAGLWNGMVYGLAELLSKIPGVGDKIETWMKENLQIHSPSKMTEKMGVQLMQGFVVGMDKEMHNTENGITDVMSETISALGETINSDLDDELVITPILDLSNVQSGTRDISRMMNGINGSNLSVTGRLARSTANGINTKPFIDQNQNGSVTNNNQTDNYYNTFNITSDNPEEVARQTDILLQKNRVRANLAKGGV